MVLLTVLAVGCSDLRNADTGETVERIRRIPGVTEAKARGGGFEGGGNDRVFVTVRTSFSGSTQLFDLVHQVERAIWETYPQRPGTLSLDVSYPMPGGCADQPCGELSTGLGRWFGPREK
ncbi:hypothetical protein LI90_166 [Carbonactinospora thermoautotrophica]|uniref:Uncharacterized protein n=2 Tax=Carbonactinospora thermoautotrophica TaxID=1469144 RepID=A0A132ML76_9ACTN|nr:hypothetical protein LI90_166 [Carbonactinospora thermoautotrophica]